MAEPTLGARIMDAAGAWAVAYTVENEEYHRVLDTLAALCERADAAERGMVALVAERATWAAFRDADEGIPADHFQELYRAMTEADDRLREALAAWRAINGEVGG